MNFRKRWISILVLVVILFAVTLAGMSVMNKEDEPLSFTQTKKETIKLWYTDETLTDYLLSKAVAYNESHDGRVEVELVSGIEFIEEINKETIAEEGQGPDLFIITNDSIEKAYLAGLACEITKKDYLDNSNLFSDAARNAVTYNGKYVAYPFSYETAALLYNKTYLHEIAEANEIADSQSLVPSSIVDILTFADSYSAPENVEYFFKWDVTDIFYNYFFIGNYINVGGNAGDNENEISIYNNESISSMIVYQQMNQFFSIDAQDSNYESILKDFSDGKIIYTIATSDCMAKLIESGTEYEYGIAMLPDINSDLKTKGMSVTNSLVVNGYSIHKDIANDFVAFIYDTDTECSLYTLSGKMPAWKQQSYPSESVEKFYESYSQSTPISKLIKTSNFWIELEACFAKVWSGEDANTEIRNISEQIKSQISGEGYSEQILPDPEVELLEKEEYDDEYEEE